MPVHAGRAGPRRFVGTFDDHAYVPATTWSYDSGFDQAEFESIELVRDEKGNPFMAKSRRFPKDNRHPTFDVAVNAVLESRQVSTCLAGVTLMQRCAKRIKAMSTQ